MAVNHTDESVAHSNETPGARAKIKRTALLYSHEHNAPGTAFKMRDGKVYGVAADGAFCRGDKDQRSVKERKRARREMRTT